MDIEKMLHEKEAQDLLEKRATVRLFRYWMSLRRADTTPFFRDFDPRRNPVPWEQCCLMTLNPPDQAPIFDHIGGKLWTALDKPFPYTVGAAPLPALIVDLKPKIAETSCTGSPLESAGELALPAGGKVLYRSVLLPFLGSRQALRYVLGAITYTQRA